MNLFDAAEAERRKEAGMARAAAARPALLAIARDVARHLAVVRGAVTSDDVAYHMTELGHHYDDLGNAAGSVFRGGFEWTGEVRTSERASTHGRVIRVWRIKGER
jgi:hypothetical protein